jgi:hypothetical protein
VRSFGALPSKLDSWGMTCSPTPVSTSRGRLQGRSGAPPALNYIVAIYLIIIGLLQLLDV